MKTCSFTDAITAVAAASSLWKGSQWQRQRGKMCVDVNVRKWKMRRKVMPFGEILCTNENLGDNHVTS
jgi:hypothetical protein